MVEELYSFLEGEAVGEQLDHVVKVVELCLCPGSVGGGELLVEVTVELAHDEVVDWDELAELVVLK